MNHRVLVVTSEMPAGLGHPTAGGGLRAWNLAAGLRQQGFEVEYALNRSVAEAHSLPEECTRHVWTPANLSRVVMEAAPDVLVFCQWEPMSHLEAAPCPVAVDLFGLLLLENWFRGVGEIQVQAQAKLRTLARADAFIVTSPTLRAYFTAWLTMAGVSPEDFPLLDVPISLPDEMPALSDRSAAGELEFVYSGIFWPWQNPALPLATLAETLERAGKGKLVIYGGRHPSHEVSGEAAMKAGRFLHQLKGSERVEIRGLVPHEELMAAFADLDVAVDLMEANIERELSSPIRSVCYLWAGLPPVVSDYLYLAGDLERSEAGWKVDPGDPAAMRRLFEWMLEHPGEVRSRRAKAQAFARGRHTWSAALRPLAEFCEAPRYRQKGRHLLDTTLERLRAMQAELETTASRLQEAESRYYQERAAWLHREHALEDRLHRAEHDLEAIRSKFLFRLFKRVQDIIAPERKPVELPPRDE